MNTQAAFYSRLRDLQAHFNAMEPELEVTLRDKAQGVEGHIVVWNTAISRSGPLPNCAKGGTRIRAGLTREEVGMLARNMALKNAAAGLPLGGCKSGINANPGGEGFEGVYRRFVELSRPFTYENGGVFGGFGFDIGAAPEHALWACDTLKSTRSFTGKPVHLGGTDYDREGIAGLGVAVSAAELIRLHNENIEKLHFGVHGVGAMGAAVIRYFHEYGARLNALGDPKYGGTWQFERAISRELSHALITQDRSRTLVLLEKEGRKLSNDANAVLFMKTDVLFPCAIHNVITADNCEDIAARYIVEGANSPCAETAYQKLYQRGIAHIPDFIANAGGVIAAFVELTSQISDEENARTRGKVTAAKRYTEKQIANNVGHIVEHAQRSQIPMRDAALHFALEAVLQHESH